MAGVAVRLWVLSRRGSFFLDEASLALNVLGRGYAGLALPLDWGQAAPVGFLWAEKVLTGLLGPSEWVLRLMPFLAGSGTLILVWRVGRKVAGETTAMLVAVALSVSLLAIRYSAEAKPYATDGFVALGLVALALNVLARPDSARRWIWLGVAGALGIALSLPSAFVLAATGAALLRDGWRQRPAIRAIAAGSATAWLVVFGMLWLLVIRDASGGAYLREYWAPVMLDPRAPDFFARVVRALSSAVATPLQWTGSIAVALTATASCIIGLFVMAQVNWRHAVLLGGPFAFAAMASAAGAYPLSDRLAFFAAPLALIVAALPVGRVADEAQRAFAARIGARAGAVVPWVVSCVAAGLVAAWVGADGAAIVRMPGSLERTHALFASVRAEAEATPVYVFARAVPAWVYATTDWDTPDRERFASYLAAAGSTDAPAHENLSRQRPVRPGEGDTLVYRGARATELIGLAPGVRYRIVGPTSADRPSPGWDAVEARRIRAVANPSVWVVASHYFEGTALDEFRPLAKALEREGLRVVEERRGGRDAIAVRFAVATPDSTRR